MDFGKLKRAFKAPLKYEALRQLYIEANRTIVHLSEALKKAENQLLQKGVDEHFLEEQLDGLKAEISQLKASAGQSTEVDTYVVLYDHFDTRIIDLLTQDKEKAEKRFKENKLFDLYHYQGELIVGKKTHREQGSALFNPLIKVEK